MYSLNKFVPSPFVWLFSQTMLSGRIVLSESLLSILNLIKIRFSIWFIIAKVNIRFELQFY